MQSQTTQRSFRLVKPIFGAAGEEDTSPPANQTVVVDGKEYSVDDVQELLQGNMRERDYRQKTMELADARKELDAQKAALNTPPPSPEPTHISPDDDEDVDDDPIGNGRVSKDVKALASTVDKLVNQVNQDREDRQARDAEAQKAARSQALDALFDHAEGLVASNKSKYGLASIQAIGMGVENHFHRTGRLPSSTEVTKLVEDSHREIAARGGQLREPTGESIPPEDSTSPDAAAAQGASPNPSTPRPQLSHDDDVERDLVKFMTDRGMGQ